MGPKTTTITTVGLLLIVPFSFPAAFAEEEVSCEEAIFGEIAGIEPGAFEETWNNIMSACDENAELILQILENMGGTYDDLKNEAGELTNEAEDVWSLLMETEDSGSGRPTTADAQGTWKLRPRVETLSESPPSASQVDHCLSDPDQADPDICDVIETCTTTAHPDQCADALTEFADFNEVCEPINDVWICPAQADRGRIYEETSWDMPEDDPAEDPKEDATRDAIVTAAGCAAVAVIGGPGAGAGCAAAGGTVMADKAVRGDYSAKAGGGHYHLTWDAFGWEDPILDNPTESSMSSGDLVVQTEMVFPFAGPNPKEYEAAKMAANREVRAAAETFNALVGDADANVIFKLPLGLLELSVTASGTGVVTIEGDTNVQLAFEGEARVDELSLLGWVRWTLHFEGAGEGKTINALADDL